MNGLTIPTTSLATLQPPSPKPPPPPVDPMIVAPHSFLVPNNAMNTSPKQPPASPSDFLSKYSVDVPAAIASLSNTKVSTLLDPFYEPGCFDVVCGRGKGSYNRPGNKHFRALVATYIEAYQQARTKVDKSAVLNSIVDKVRSYTNPDTGLSAQFVKYSKSTGWVQIGDDHAREKVGHAIREAVMAKEGGAPATSKRERHSTSPIPFPTRDLQDDFDDFEPASRRESFTPLPAFGANAARGL